MPWLEPPADLRSAARTIREMYEAYVEVGFTSMEAIVLIGYHIQAQGRGKD